MPAKKPSATGIKRKKILLVDDHPLMRRGQADLLEREADLAVCGEAGTARAAMEAIAKLQPDLVVVDMALPDKDGLELIKDIQSLHPGLPVLAMSMQDESLYAPRVLRAGGRGYEGRRSGIAGNGNPHCVERPGRIKPAHVREVAGVHGRPVRPDGRRAGGEIIGPRIGGGAAFWRRVEHG